MRMVKAIFDWRVRGVRGVNAIGFALVAAMVFSVYLAKADAAGESARIAEMERDIRVNGERVRMLRAQVARLESPVRLEALSRQAGLAPVDARHQADEDDLARLAPPSAAAQAAAPPDAVDPSGDAEAAQ